MALTLKLDETDVAMVRRALRAIAARPEECGKILWAASYDRSLTGEVVSALARIADYIETVERAG